MTSTVIRGKATKTGDNETLFSADLKEEEEEQEGEKEGEEEEEVEGE